VVAVGETEYEPAATGVTAPIVLSSKNDVALVVVHERDEDEPVCIAVGFAESVQVGAFGGGGGGVVVTVTSAEQVIVCPSEPDTVRVKSVVVAIETD
jgi:hypothetical protein